MVHTFFEIMILYMGKDRVSNFLRRNAKNNCHTYMVDVNGGEILWQDTRKRETF